MKTIYVVIRTVLLTATLIVLSGCQKFLDVKPNVGYAVPSKISDLQALLDYFPTMNNKDAGSGEISSDDYSLTDAVWAALSTDYFKNMYVWNDKGLFAPSNNEWNNLYQVVYISNTVLDEIKNIERTGNEKEFDNVKGQALVFRAKSFLQIASIWSLSYDRQTAGTDLGIPLRLNSNFNEPSTRSTVEETYKRIIEDLKEASILLPPTSVSPLRPNKAAAYGFLSRTFLFMREYAEALKYADSCLSVYSELLDYKDLNPGAAYPISRFNKEVIMESYIPGPEPLNPTRARINMDLYNLYEDNDLRKSVFYKQNTDGSYAFKGSYEGGLVLFSGIATDEIYLIRAEANARLGNYAEAVLDLNDLLRHRYDSTFEEIQLGNKDWLLKRILEERRKELTMRGLRWPDIKRLNKEGINITLVRHLNGNQIRLEPEDNRFALPLPEDIIQLTGMVDNPR